MTYEEMDNYIEWARSAFGHDAADFLSHGVWLGWYLARINSHPDRTRDADIKAVITMRIEAWKRNPAPFENEDWL